MFGLAYVILPFSSEPPVEAIRASLSRFRTGGRGDVPEDWLVFEDETDVVRRLHAGRFVFTASGVGSTRIEGDPDDVTWRLDISVVRREMERRGLSSWSVRFDEVEPDIAAFAARFVRGLERHPASGGFGLYRNGLGQWDWWDLGGRFDGAIRGERKRAGRSSSSVSSGPSQGRAVLDGVAGALTKALGGERTSAIDVRADDNIELVSWLLDEARAGRDARLPTALVLPPGSADDRLRWIGTWPEVGPAETLAALGLPAASEWRDVVEAAYGRLPDHWAAGVAYHF